MTKEVIVKSFEAYGISVSVNGEDESKIHCSKDGEIAVGAQPMIEAKTKALLESPDDEDEDQFTDIIEDDEELDTNELSVEDV